jgi:hypothetical protein
MSHPSRSVAALFTEDTATFRSRLRETAKDARAFGEVCATLWAGWQGDHDQAVVTQLQRMVSECKELARRLENEAEA